MRVTDDQLSSWTKPAFGNEEKLATDTEAAIRRAVQQHPILSSLNLRILPKGSFKNSTNVRRDSDIDIAVVHQGQILLDFHSGATFANSGLIPYTGISSSDFKAAVGEAMRREFGAMNVDGSGNKVFRLRGSDKVINADIIPCTRYWHMGPQYHHEGIELILDRPDGRRHFNYPDQHFNEGVAKNNRTGRRYKSSVRILKNIENKLVADGVLNDFPSFLIECLAHNVPDAIYNDHQTWREIVANACVHIWGYVNSTAEPDEIIRWREVSGRKYLFGDHQRWTKQDATNFVEKIYEAVG
jgi:hypothetical protein